jgi:hypothetical protein
MLIKRVYEIDPLSCPQCGGQMKVISFIEPPQREVVKKVLRHCGPEITVWRASLLKSDFLSLCLFGSDEERNNNKERN